MITARVSNNQSHHYLHASCCITGQQREQLALRSLKSSQQRVIRLWYCQWQQVSQVASLILFCFLSYQISNSSKPRNLHPTFNYSSVSPTSTSNTFLKYNIIPLPCARPLCTAGPSTSHSRSRPPQKVEEAALEAMIAMPIFSTLVPRAPEAAENPSSNLQPLCFPERNRRSLTFLMTAIIRLPAPHPPLQLHYRLKITFLPRLLFPSLHSPRLQAGHCN